MARNRSRAELQAENRYLRKQSRNEVIIALGTQLIKWGGLFGIAFVAYLSIAALAGKVTRANVLINFLGDVKVSYVASWALAVGGVGYGTAQARLRKDTQKRLGDHIKKLEEEIDIRRSSSQ